MLDDHGSRFNSVLFILPGHGNSSLQLLGLDIAVGLVLCRFGRLVLPEVLERLFFGIVEASAGASWALGRGFLGLAPLESWRPWLSVPRSDGATLPA